jgi:HlyD family secretion protein
MLRRMSDDDGVALLALERPVRLVPRFVRWGLVGACGLAVAGFLVLARGGVAEGPRYVTAKIQRGELVATVTASGTLKARNTVEVGAEVSGLIRAVHVDYNTRVERGQVLAELETEQFDAAVREAEANVHAAHAAVQLAQVSLTEARSALQRTSGLASKGLTPAQELEAVQAKADRADAELASSRARLELAQAGLVRARTTRAHATIRSPVDGVVLERSVEPGQTVAATLQAPVLFTLAEDLRNMVLHVNVDEADIGKVREGQEASFRVDAYPSQDFEAVIDSVRNAAQSLHGVITYEALFRVDNAERLLRPGMSAVATVVCERRAGALLVPNAALRFEPTAPKEGEEHVSRLWVLESGGLKALPVEVLGSDGRNSQVGGPGVTDGREVVVDVERGEQR